MEGTPGFILWHSRRQGQAIEWKKCKFKHDKGVPLTMRFCLIRQ